MSSKTFSVFMIFVFGWAFWVASWAKPPKWRMRGGGDNGWDIIDVAKNDRFLMQRSLSFSDGESVCTISKGKDGKLSIRQGDMTWEDCFQIDVRARDEDRKRSGPVELLKWAAKEQHSI